MPKLIELTLELCIHKVSCPGVWLCQDGRVSLTVFALGTSYQTCLLPPVFPLMFKDIFYFRKRFQESCTLNNICCLLDGETIYCELVQWCDDCSAGDCIILAQYLGAMNDILFPPNMCSNDGVDLLMRRSKEFPGILSPKIEISTKVRIDEVWNQPGGKSKVSSCRCATEPETRQKQVCHSPMFHRNERTRVRRVKSWFQNYWTDLHEIKHNERSVQIQNVRHHAVEQDLGLDPNPDRADHDHALASDLSRKHIAVTHHQPRRCSPRRPPRVCPQYNVYNVDVSDLTWPNKFNDDLSELDKRSSTEIDKCTSDIRSQKTTIESRYIEDDTEKRKEHKTYVFRPKISPCVCQICKRYHELFHGDKS